jgi:hypothetical protein
MKPASIGNDALEFVKVAGRILSPALLTRELTEKECTLIAAYVNELANGNHPWTKFLPSSTLQEPPYQPNGTGVRLT